MEIAIIGGGPAGLRAAEVAASHGAKVCLFEAKASVGRKFLVAGRGGLNLTKSQERSKFVEQYRGPEMPAEFWSKAIAEFDPDALRQWAAGLGVETFVASTGRVYPRELKAAPLLRRWVQRLRDHGAELKMHHRWNGLISGDRLTLQFEHQGEVRIYEADAAILALGGGSWPQTGSDGAWVHVLESVGIGVAPLQSANCGWETDWSPEVLAKAEGHPLKSIGVRAGATAIRGELMVTAYGLEGGAVYQLGPELRAMPDPRLWIDFKPTFSVPQLVAKMGPIRANFLTEARQRWRLSEASTAILGSRRPGGIFASAEELAGIAKACPIPLKGPRPIAEAISSAGGVRWPELNSQLMLKHLPGVFIAGEMLDWEAPTGGYLMQGCFASGTHAAHSALAWLKSHPSVCSLGGNTPDLLH